MSYERAVSIQLLTERDLAEDSLERLVKSNTEICKYIMFQNLTLLAEVAKCLPFITRQGNKADLSSLSQRTTEVTGGKLQDELCFGTTSSFEAKL